MNNRKQLRQELKKQLAEYKESKQHQILKDAQKTLAALGRSTKELKREAEQQQTKLFWWKT